MVIDVPLADCNMPERRAKKCARSGTATEECDRYQVGSLA